MSDSCKKAIVSVIVPNYNHASFLPQRLESIYNQSFQDFEVIIIDDCSTDNSREIIEQYRDHPKVKTIVYNESNSGRPILQWLKGINLATTEWVWIAESDDYCEATFLATLSPAFDHENVVLALSDICFVNNNDEIINSFPPTSPGIYNGDSFITNKMLDGCFVCNSGMAVFRKSAVPDSGSWMEQFSFSPDYYFWAAIMQKGKVYACGKRLAYFRKHDQEFTHGKLESVAAQQDHVCLLKELHQKGLCTKSQLEQLVEEKLVSYYSRRSGIAPAEFSALVYTWKQLAKAADIAVNDLYLQSKAMVRKFKHRIKTIHAIA